MKRKSLLFALLVALFMPWAANAQTVTIGTGTSAHNSAPIANYYNYSLAEMLFTSAEIGTTDVNTILSLGFEGAAACSKTYSITVYMKNVDATSFTSSDDYIQVSASDVVYTGSIKPASGWNTIELAEPFAYDNTKSLLVVVQKTSGGYDGNTAIWKYTSTSSPYMMLYAQNDGTTFDPTTLTTLATNAERPNVQLTFGTPPSCSAPMSVTATFDGNVTWEGEGTTWNLNYKASTASTWTEVNGLTSMSYTIPNLAGLTTYSVRVQNVCDDNTTTGWTYANDFTTPARIPLVEPFNNGSSAPNSWTRYSGLLSGVMDGTVTLGTITSGWNFGTGNGVFDNHAKVNVYGSSCKYWLVTSTLTMENNVQLSFDVAYTAYSGSGAPAQTGTDDKFVVLITTDGGTTWTILRQWDNAGSEYVLNNLNPTPATVTYDLSSYAGQSIAVAFYAESTSSNADNNLHIDNVSIDYIPSCFKPTELNATNITANAAELSWTANSGESAWKLYWKKASDENYTEEAITSNPYTLNGLDDNTEYVFYVVANCGGSDGESDPSNTYTFATSCEAFEVTEETQYTYGFETSDLFGCWTVIAGAAIQNNSNQAHESTYALKFSGTSNNMVALPPFVNATNTLRLEFWTRPESNTNSSCGSFDVGYMTDLADANSFVAVETYAYNDWTSAVFEKKTVDFVNAPENAYIAMRQYNNVTSWYWFVDDVTVKLMPSCLAPTGLAVVENSVTAHEASLTWTAEEGATFQWHIDGTWTDTQDNTVALTGLTADADYTFTLRKKCSDTDFSEAITVNFHTLEACPAPTGFAVAENGLAGRTATLTWTGTSNSYTVSYRTKAYTDGVEEGFSTPSTPSGWENKTGLLSNVMGGTALSTTSQWSFGTSNGVFDQHARINIYGTSRYGWLITPEIELPADAALSFDLALTAYNGTVAAPATTGTDDRFIVLISTDNEATWTILREWNNSGSTYVYNNIAHTATGENVSIDLSAYAGQSVRIAFYGESTESNADNNLHIDNVAVGSPVAAGEWQTVTTEETTVTLTGLTPETLYEAKVQGDCGEEGLSDETALITFTTLISCPAPTNLAVNYTGGVTAQVTWLGTAETYNIDVNGTVINDVTTPYTLTGLELATIYAVKVQANCENNETSDWTAPISFTTDPCMPEDQCEITFELTDSYGDGWNGAAINVVDVLTNTVIATMTATPHGGGGVETTDTKTLAVCDEREIQFVWVSGNYDEECSYVVKDASGEVIFSGEDAMTEPVNYTMNCPALQTFTKTIVGYGTGTGNYYLIASPIGDVNPTEVDGLVTDAFDLYYFDEEGDNDGNEWINYDPNTFDLVSGKGYLYASQDTTVLTFTGTPVAGTTYEVTLAKTEDADWSGWNLVGNPFAQTAYINGDFEFYTMNNAGDKLWASTSNSIEAMEGVFVIANQDEETLTFTTEDPANPGKNVVLNVSDNHGLVDRAIVRFGGSRQLPKFQLNPNSTKLYIPMDDNDYAVVRSEEVGEMPVNFKAENDGSYTISIENENVEFAYLHLLDNMTNTDVDLLETPNYSFNARMNDNANRFKLVFATGTLSVSDNFAFFNNGSLVINNEGEATMQVIDINGRVLSSETINGNANVNVDAAAGVYMIRLVNGNNVKVQKIVVR